MTETSSLDSFLAVVLVVSLDVTFVVVAVTFATSATAFVSFFCTSVPLSQSPGFLPLQIGLVLLLASFQSEAFLKPLPSNLSDLVASPLVSFLAAVAFCFLASSVLAVAFAGLFDLVELPA